MTSEDLTEMLPEATVVGGSFAESLPPVDTLTAEERRETLAESRGVAMRSLVEELVRSEGLEVEIPLRRGAGGERLWPTGYVGSASNKGAVVLGALASTEVLDQVGIDVELLQAGYDEISKTLRPNEGLPVQEEALSQLGGFSAKEAAYKAFYPLDEEVLGFLDIKLEWQGDAQGTFHGMAHCASGRLVEIRSRCSGDWVVCAALAHTGTLWTSVR